MKPTAAVEALEELKGEVAKADGLYRNPGAAASWKTRVRSVITRSLGAGHDLVSKLDDNSYELAAWTDKTTDAEIQQAFTEGIWRACGYIDAAIYELRIDGEVRDRGHDKGSSVRVAPVDSNRARKVFVVHGRNRAASAAMFTFLRAIGLEPIEWSVAVTMTGEGSPYIGQVLDTAFDAAQAVVVLLTPDDVAYLRSEYASGEDDPEIVPLAQARPNVLFEAGMAMGRDLKRTVLVEFGKLRPFSDVAGRHAVRIDSTASKRKDLAQRLGNAGCDVNLVGEEWLTAGDFTPPGAPGAGLPLGKRLPGSGSPRGVRLDARFHKRSKGGRLEIVNQGSEPIYDLDIEFPEGLQGFYIVDPGFPVPKLPGGKSLSLVCSLTMPRNVSYFDLLITGHTAAGDPVHEEAFVDLAG
jgi:predicted nucleotide-binding protein